MTDDSSKFDRRSVLKGIGSGFAVSTFGAVQPTAADGSLSEEFKDTARRYDDVDSAQRAVAEHVGELQSLLAAEGVIRGGGVFEIDSLVGTPTDGEMTFVSATTRDGQLTSEIRLARDLGDRWLNVFVMPDVGQSYAAVHENGETTVYDPERDDDGVVDISSECMTQAGCVAADVDCGSCTEREAACCPDGSCYFTGYVTGDCGCQTGCFDSSCCALCGC